MLRFEGDMKGPWVEEANRVCEPLLNGAERLRIDLSGVGFTDRSGVKLLTLLQQNEAVFENCPAFLKAQLRSAGQFSLGQAARCAADG